MDFRWLRNNLPAGSVVIASSVSGRTNRTIEAAKAAKGAGTLMIGITDNVDSPIVSYCDYIIPTETSPPETLTQHDYAGYQYVVPLTFRTMLMFTEAQNLAPIYNFSEFFSMVGTILLICGLIFTFPIFIYTLKQTS